MVRDTVKAGWRALEVQYGCAFLENQITTTSVNSAHRSLLHPRYYETVPCVPRLPDE